MKPITAPLQTQQVGRAGGCWLADAPLRSPTPCVGRVFPGPFPLQLCWLQAVISLNRTGKEFCFHVVGKQRPTQISVELYGQAGELGSFLGGVLTPTAPWEQGLWTTPASGSRRISIFPLYK